MKTETGLMVVKNGKGWNSIYNDGRSSIEGWVNIEDAEIHDPQFCKKPTDVTYDGSPYTKELLTAELKLVQRTTQVIFLPMEES
jgi:hypothetical protein